jgi:DNA-binding LacI/PurR family transcriptional regulator
MSMQSQTIQPKKPIGRRLGSHPAYRAIAEKIRSQVASGMLVPGALLPSHRMLAAEHGVAIGTVQQAVATLVADGILVTEANRGLFVANGASEAIDGASASNRRASSAHIGIITPMAVAWDETKTIRIDDGNSGEDVRRKIVDSIEHSIGSLGGSTSCRDIGGKVEKLTKNLKDAVQDLVTERVDALILVYVPDEMILAEVLPVVDVRTTPIILVMAESSNLPLPRLTLDQQSAGYAATEHLIKQGCREIAYFCPFESEWTTGRLAGIRDAVRLNLGVGEEIELISTGVDVHEVGDMWEQFRFFDKVAQAYCDTHDRPPHGIVCANDWAALRFIEVARTKGWVAGKDYLIVGFDDLKEARQFGLSSMRPPAAEFGARAAKLAAEQVQSGTRDAARISVRSNLIVRATTRHRFANSPKE